MAIISRFMSISGIGYPIKSIASKQAIIINIIFGFRVL